MYLKSARDALVAVDGIHIKKIAYEIQEIYSIFRVEVKHFFYSKLLHN